jgi:hypothetical protein
VVASSEKKKRGERGGTFRHVLVGHGSPVENEWTGPVTPVEWAPKYMEIMARGSLIRGLPPRGKCRKPPGFGASKLSLSKESPVQ